MPTVAAPKCVVIVAGETSGDNHGANLVRAMQQRDPNLFFCGIGGMALKKAGVRIIVDAAQLAVVGITEVLPKAVGILRGMAAAKRLLRSLKPDLLILIDFPEFNLHLAATAKRQGIPVLYYISPQVWAWRRGRVKRIAERVDHMAVILPFEEAFYREHHVPVTFVGHPLLDSHSAAQQESYGYKKDFAPTIGLLPGSRDHEIVKHLPIMLESACILKKQFADAKFIVSHAPSVDRKHIDAVLHDHGFGAEFEIASGCVEKIFPRCDFIIVASGTVTLQAAIHGTPMVIIYKVSPVSYWLGRALIRVKYIGLVNLVAGKQLVPEFIQHSASAANIAQKVSAILADSNQLLRLRRELLELREVLGGSGASDRVADIAMGLIAEKMR